MSNLTRPVLLGCAAAFLVLADAPGAAQAVDIPALIQQMQTAYADLDDYTATFIRRERIEGELRAPETILLKFRKPERIYMRFTVSKAVGREILFVKGRDEDRALIHERGWKTLFTIVIAPDDALVLKESRHPITDVGIGRLIDLLAAGTSGRITNGELRWREVAPAGEASPTRRIELLSSVVVANCSCQRVIVTIDVASRLPVGAEIFDGSDQLLGTYEYHDIRINPQLTDRDFDPGNSNYTFPSWRISY
jgi:hypothetical protein